MEVDTSASSSFTSIPLAVSTSSSSLECVALSISSPSVLAPSQLNTMQSDGALPHIHEEYAVVPVINDAVSAPGSGSGGAQSSTPPLEAESESGFSYPLSVPATWCLRALHQSVSAPQPGSSVRVAYILNSTLPTGVCGPLVLLDALLAIAIPFFLIDCIVILASSSLQDYSNLVPLELSFFFLSLSLHVLIYTRPLTLFLLFCYFVGFCANFCVALIHSVTLASNGWDDIYAFCAAVFLLIMVVRMTATLICGVWSVRCYRGPQTQVDGVELQGINAVRSENVLHTNDENVLFTCELQYDVLMSLQTAHNDGSQSVRVPQAVAQCYLDELMNSTTRFIDKQSLATSTSTSTSTSYSSASSLAAADPSKLSVEMCIKHQKNEEQSQHNEVVTVDMHDDEEENVCAICLHEFKQDDRVKFLPCCHRFHAGCIAEWLQHKNSCATCRLPVIVFVKKSSAHSTKQKP